MLRLITQAGLTTAQLAKEMKLPEAELLCMLKLLEQKKVLEFLKTFSEAMGRCPCHFIADCNMPGCNKAGELQDRVIYLQNTILSILRGNVDPDINNLN